MLFIATLILIADIGIISTAYLFNVLNPMITTALVLLASLLILAALTICMVGDIDD